MTASQVIDEIKRLPQEEQAKVLEFTRALSAAALTPDEIGALARRMAQTDDKHEADQLEEEIVRGFYGKQKHA